MSASSISRGSTRTRGSSPSDTVEVLTIRQRPRAGYHHVYGHLLAVARRATGFDFDGVETARKRGYVGGSTRGCGGKQGTPIVDGIGVGTTAEVAPSECTSRCGNTRSRQATAAHHLKLHVVYGRVACIGRPTDILERHMRAVGGGERGGVERPRAYGTLDSSPCSGEVDSVERYKTAGIGGIGHNAVDEATRRGGNDAALVGKREFEVSGGRGAFGQGQNGVERVVGVGRAEEEALAADAIGGVVGDEGLRIGGGGGAETKKLPAVGQGVAGISRGGSSASADGSTIVVEGLAIRQADTIVAGSEEIGRAAVATTRGGNHHLAGRPFG